ncbi:MAG: hypothetical protein CMJ18_09875 [Phycisphaeraceae bacterium]|nr:hypothetical protein [Phycisphaeraceae bacterium]
MKTLIQALRDGDIVFGATVTEHLRPSVVKAFVNAGFDFLFIENEHGSFDMSHLSNFVLHARDNGTTVVAKIPHLERAETARLLEMGVMGLQLPRTESREDVATLHDFIKFPPVGSRASATGYGNTMYGKVPDKRAWYDQANEETFVVAHIETRAGAEHIEQILDSGGADVCFVGPSDLSLSYGMPGRYQDSEFRAIVQRIFDAAAERNIPRGYMGLDREDVQRWIDQGVQLFECVSELDLIRLGAMKFMDELRDLK